MKTRWYHCATAFFAAIFFTNALPHFISGVLGMPFPSPFAEPPGIGLSTPVENIIWAIINFCVAYALVYFGKLDQRQLPIRIAFFVGAIVMAFYAASYFGSLDL